MHQGKFDEAEGLLQEALSKVSAPLTLSMQLCMPPFVFALERVFDSLFTSIY